ncbi:hypothetical protein BV20DRAFT_951172 [Pilatotrama ljubarskyi]|nr:hypothetical protein BV20DRAFT_951172 [Pilatotrama ljubarskyi]
MHVIFLEDDPLNSVVVNKDTREVVYNIITPFSLATHKTTIYNAQGLEVAYYKRQTFAPNEISYHGQVLPASDWLQRDGIFSRRVCSSRRFMSPDGRTYKWKQLNGKSKFQLIDCETEQVVAESYGTRYGILSEERDMDIEVSDAVVPILDVIVLSFIILEKKRRDR